jgi:hypothetical protein
MSVSIICDAYSGRYFIYSNYNLFTDGSRGYITPVEFITLKNNSERLVIDYDDHKRKLVIDPYQAYDEIDISDDLNDTIVITKLNRKIFTKNGNVYITNGIDVDENKLQQLPNKILYRNSIYTLFTFKIIQSMLNKIIDQEDIKNVVPSDEWIDDCTVVKDEVEIENLGLCKIFFRDIVLALDSLLIQINDKQLRLLDFPKILSFKLLNNQDLVLIHMRGISIYTINENSRHRYFWHNNEWNDIYEKFKKDCDGFYDINFTNKYYKSLIERILKNEFDDSKHSSIPFPPFLEYNEWRREWRRDVVEDFINDNLVSPKFGTEMLKIAIEGRCNDVFQQIIKSNQDYSENYMTIISLNIPKLCDNYPDYIIKYISCTSIMLSPYCLKIGNSKNTSLYSYTDIYIKESNMENNYFKPIFAAYKRLIRYLSIKEEIQIVSFIVPFPQICVYQDNSKNNDHKNHETVKNHDIKSKIIKILKIIMMMPKSNSIWNEFLYKQKSILFCNIDSNRFYNWWNFAAIIDFKWKTFGRVYYYLIWLFYTIFYVCYSLASILEQMPIPDFYFKLLFIISIIFGSIFLIFEFRYCLWNYEYYFKDIWNLFGK